MSRLVKKWIPTLLFATLPGLIVLSGYLSQNPVLTYLRDTLIEWAVVVAAFALLLGLFNIARVHGRRVLRRRRGWVHSLVLLFAAVAFSIPPILYGPSDKLTLLTFDYVIGPLGASLAALVVFTLALATFRLLRGRRGWEFILSWGFILIVAVVLLGSTPMTGLSTVLEPLADVRDWIVNKPGMAGMRGMLLGVALGTVITALRVLGASDRPHSEL